MPPQYDKEGRMGSDPTTQPADGNYASTDTNEPLLGQPPLMEMSPISAVVARPSFVAEFVKSRGPPQIVIMMILLALGFGSTIGVVPAVVTDRFARLNHGYTDVRACSDYSIEEKPQECLQGSADAQNSAAMASMISNTFTFFTSSLMGSLSDEHGRRAIIILGVTISSLSQLALLLLQCQPEMSPFWYYLSESISGIVSWVAVSLSALSDVMPPQWRAASFGMLLAGFSVGFAVAPFLALLLGHFGVSILSLSAVWTGLLSLILFFPETLPPETANEARTVRAEQMRGLHGSEKVLWWIYRPIRELSILNRSRLFRLLSCLAFCSGMVASGDQTLLVYYIEERLGFDDKDIASMFLVIGLLGIFVQGCVLKFINDCFGERKVVMLAYTLGAVTNLMYAFANHKYIIFLAVSVGSFVGMAFPTISAIKANNVHPSEQGRIQGALYSLSALAMASGPTAMRFVYHYTKNGAWLGPGSMFVLAAGLYLLAVACAYALPLQADSKRNEANGTDGVSSEEQAESTVETPLLVNH